MVDLVIRGGRLVDVARHAAEPTDILIEGERIVTVGAPGAAAPADARVIDARGLLMMPGLVNAHTHSHGNLGKGTGDRWTLELLLNAGPWISGNRNVEDTYLSALIGASIISNVLPFDHTMRLISLIVLFVVGAIVQSRISGFARS